MGTVSGVCCLLVVLLRCGSAQFQAIFGSPALTTNAGPIICADKLDNCALFTGSCGGQYEAWARDNCALTCQYCQGPPTTPIPCVDVLPNCDTYEAAACSSPDFHAWAVANCRVFCKFCTPDHTTTIAPQNCVDKLDCRLYGQASCTGEYEHWAKENCMNFCGFCQGLPTTPRPCLDTRPNCAQYDTDMCTNPDYNVWVEDNCRAHCGRCGGGTTHHAMLTPPPLGQTTAGMNVPLLPGKK